MASQGQNSKVKAKIVSWLTRAYQSVGGHHDATHRGCLCQFETYQSETQMSLRVLGPTALHENLFVFGHISTPKTPVRPEDHPPEFVSTSALPTAQCSEVKTASLPLRGWSSRPADSGSRPEHTAQVLVPEGWRGPGPFPAAPMQTCLVTRLRPQPWTFVSQLLPQVLLPPANPPLCLPMYLLWIFQINRIIQHLIICNWIISLNTMFSRSVHVRACVSILFNWQGCFTAQIYYILLSIHQPIDIWMIFTFWLLRMMPLRTSITRFCFDLCSLLLVIYLGVEFLGHVIPLCINF